MTTTAHPAGGGPGPGPATAVGLDGGGPPTSLPGARALRSRPGLLALAIGVPLMEVFVIWLLAPTSSIPLAVHVTAPEPFATFHDLRWLLVYHPNIWAFFGEVLVFLAFRTALTTALVHEAWPDSVVRPPLRRLAARVCLFTFVTALVLSPWAALAFGIAVMSLSWLFFVAVPATLFLAVLLHPGAVVGTWWRHAPPLRTVGWILLAFVVLTLAGGLLASAPAAAIPFGVAAVGLFNAWAWNGIVHGVLFRRPVRYSFMPLAPAGIAGILVVAAVGTAVGFVVAKPHPKPSPPISAADRLGKPVLVVTGFGTHWSGEARSRFPGAFDERRFSYRGLGPDGPLPYEADDTYRSIPKLAGVMSTQVDAFSNETGQKISIVAESEGALLAKAFLAMYPDAPVDRLVMLSPLVRPARVYYPPDGSDGWGVAASWELRGLASVIRDLTPLTISTDTALFRSVADHAPVFRDLLACRTPGVKVLAITPVADAVASSELDAGTTRVLTVPAFHGGLLSNASAQRIVAEELSGQKPQGSQGWAFGDRVVRALAATWQVPELPISLNPAWRGMAPDGQGCSRARQELLQSS